MYACYLLRQLLILLTCIVGLGRPTTALLAPPTIETIVPGPGSEVRELFLIEIQFDRAVAGLDASDLLINGASATNVTEFLPGQFVFSFPQPEAGPVVVSWRGDPEITDRDNAALAFAGGTWTYSLQPNQPPPGVIISEFMADNSKTLRDEDGDASDWIELFNGSEEGVRLEGWSLTDDRQQLTKWRFPDISLGAGEYLVIFASGKNRTNITGRLHTNFKLASEGDYLGLISSQTNVVSEFAPTYPPQRVDVSYGRARGESDSLGYFVKPTPGSANSDAGTGFAPDVSFSQPGGSFTEPFELTLSNDSREAVLRYTLDGSFPTNSSPTYLAPIPITTSVQVRARSFQVGRLPGPPRSETYLALNTNVVGFRSDLPVLVIHTLGKGAPTATRQVSASVSLFEPVNGLTTLASAPTLRTRGGIKLRGSSTEGLPKASFALEFWGEFNQDESKPILGMPADSDWVLYAPNSFDPVLIHNPFIHQLSRDMGRYSSRTRFVEVYLNKSTGPVSAGNYNGIYVLEEKIKVSPHRVAIDHLRPEDTHLPEIAGGYLLKIDRLDPGDAGLSAGGQSLAYVDPKEHDIRLVQRDPQEQYIKTYLSNFGKALNGPNWLDPVQGYAAYVDVDAWIDFHVLELLSGNVDAIVLSTYFHKPRDGKIAFGPHWDFDRALGSTDGRDSNPRNWITGPFFNGWWNRMFRDPDFWQKWIDRYEELRLTHFSQTNMNRLIDQLANEVRQAQPRERQKWRTPMRGGSYQSEINLMKNWLSNRTTFIDRQLVQPPVMSSPTGQVAPGYALSLSSAPNASIYFTLDGSDPRLAQGGLAPQAQLYTAPIVIDVNTRVVARARNLAQRQTAGPPISSPWSRRVEATLVISPPPLLLTELMFHPTAPEAEKPSRASDFEFLELKNVSPNALSLIGYRFTHGIAFSFTASNAVTRLEPGERVLLVKNAAAFQTRYPATGKIGGEFLGSLSNSGQRLTLVGPMSEAVFDFTYEDRWQPLADGPGFSLVLRSEAVSADRLQDPTAWRRSSSVGGSPGSIDPAPPSVAPVLVNEIVTNPSSTTGDMLELFNPNATPTDISGWFVTDDWSQPKKHRFPPGTRIPANGYGRFDSLEFSFSKFGEQVYLFSADAVGNLTGWAHGFRFGAAQPGVSFGRYVKSTGEEAFVAQRDPTPGAPNSSPRVGPIVISEILAAPDALDGFDTHNAEFIELWNSTSESVALFDSANPTNRWQLRGTVSFDFPPGQRMAPGNYVVLVGFDPQQDALALTRFESRYGGATAKMLLGPWRGHLSNTQGSIQLLQPAPDASLGKNAAIANILVEEVNYSATAPWPKQTRDGLALIRRNAGAYADDPINWTLGSPSPGDADTDEDGLPDSWELSHGLDAGSALGENGSNGDPDHDGFVNGQEYRSGTDPNDANSWLAFQPMARIGDKVVLRFPTVPGRTYTVEYRDSLTQGIWHVLERILPADATAESSVTDTSPGAQRYYRLTTP